MRRGDIQLDIGHDQVTWSDWGYQTNYDDTVDRSEVPALGPLTFDRKQYAAVLQARLQIKEAEQ